MYVTFNNIAESSRVWIYQADQRLTTDQQRLISDLLTQYCETWKAHGAPLKSSFSLAYDHFIIIAADEGFNSTSGCSIDDSVRVIKELERQTGINFFNRNLVAFRIGDEVKLVSLSQLKENYASGMWNESTLTFNNLVDIKSKLETEWLVQAGKTWLKRYIPAEKIHS